MTTSHSPSSAPVGATPLGDLVAVTGSGAFAHLFAASTGADAVMTECGRILTGADLTPWLDTDPTARCMVCVDVFARAR